MRTLSRIRRAAQRGFTLLELSIVIVVLATVLGSIAVVLQRSQGAYQQGMVEADVDGLATRACQRIVSEVFQANRATVTVNVPPPLGATGVDFSRAEGWAAGAMVNGALRRIRWVRDPADPDNGLDDDGDGLSDEGRIELWMDVAGAPAESVVLASGVPELLEGEVTNGADDNGNAIADERGLCITFDAVNGLVVVRVTLARRDAAGRLVQRTAQMSVLLRNG